jgi:hypothetical protein
MKNLTTFLFILLAQVAFSQTVAIKGKVIDETDTPLPGVSVMLQHPWGERFQSTSTDTNGDFIFSNIQPGGYKLELKLMGYESLLGELTLKDEDLSVGILRLVPDGLNLNEVEIKSRVPMAQMNGDTTEFNAAAFKVMSDASTEELVEKIPSVTIENGKVKAQGEDVSQVLVDGKPFFGNDPTAALKNLPAEVVDKVQIFDAQSEQAQFTGFSDGNTTKTINIVTKPGMRNGQFGKVYAGYGYEDKYQTGGNINYFDGDRRISLIGMSNNINIQNFSTDDLLGVVGSSGGRGRGRGGRGGPGGDFLVRPQGGIATTHAIGLNYSDQWGKKTEVSGSYFFNNSKSDAEELTFRQFFTDEGFGEVYSEESYSYSNNTNHRFNARINIQLDSSNSLLIRPRFSAQLNDGNTTTMAQSIFGTDLLSQTDNIYRSDLTGINFNNTLLWRHQFPKKGRTVSFNLSNGYAPQKGNSFLKSSDAYYTGMVFQDSLDQKSILDVNSWNASGNLDYTEPVGENSQLMFNYQYSYQQEASDKETYDFLAPDGYVSLNESLTNVFSNDYITQQAGAGYNFRKGRDMSFNVRANAQWAELTNEKTFPNVDTFGQRFFNVLPSAMIRYKLNDKSNVRVFYRSNTDLPSVDQLQDVVDNTNPLQLKVGNPNLKQSVQHRLFLRYQQTDPENSSTLFAMAGGSVSNNYIANSTYLASADDPIFSEYDVQPGAQISQPVNLNGYYNLRSFISYGHPVGFIRSNINLDGSYNFTRSPGLLNRKLNYANTHTIGAGITLSSNISDKVDFAISARPSYSIVRNDVQQQSNTEYLTQSSSVKFNWIIVDGFVLRTNLTHNLYAGLSDAYNQNFVLWNIAIGKKLFKNERGEIALGINDVLNQNTNIQRSITETYIEDLQSNTLRQFVMLSFTYNLRHFNTGKSSSRSSEWDGERRPWGPGPPPGGGHDE